MPLKTILLIAAILIAVLAVKTLLPSSAASKLNLLGYKSACTFSPVSTLILLWITAVILVVRARLMNFIGENPAYLLTIVLSVIFLAVIAFYSYRYLSLKNVPKESTGFHSQKRSNRL